MNKATRTRDAARRRRCLSLMAGPLGRRDRACGWCCGRISERHAHVVLDLVGRVAKANDISLCSMMRSCGDQIASALENSEIAPVHNAGVVS